MIKQSLLEMIKSCANDAGVNRIAVGSDDCQDILDSVDDFETKIKLLEDELLSTVDQCLRQQNSSVLKEIQTSNFGRKVIAEIQDKADGAPRHAFVEIEATFIQFYTDRSGLNVLLENGHYKAIKVPYDKFRFKEDA